MMPPKQYLPEIFQMYTEEGVNCILHQWNITLLPLLNKLVHSINENKNTFETLKFPPDFVIPISESILSITQEIQDISLELVKGIEVLRTTISVRIPEIKSEDNLGVDVQEKFIAILTQAIKRIIGGEKESVSPFTLITTYVKDRAEAERQLIGGSDKANSPEKKVSPSSLTMLEALDRRALYEAAIGVEELKGILTSLTVLFAINKEKLFTPRTSSRIY